MRTGQTSRPYGRNYGNNANRNRQQMPPRGQNLDSNGPNVKIRGTPHQIFERYIALAREASTSGDRVAAENLYQHAEHYFRVMNAANQGHQHGVTGPTATIPAYATPSSRSFSSIIRNGPVRRSAAGSSGRSTRNCRRTRRARSSITPDSQPACSRSSRG